MRSKSQQICRLLINALTGISFKGHLGSIKPIYLPYGIVIVSGPSAHPHHFVSSLMTKDVLPNSCQEEFEVNSLGVGVFAPEDLLITFTDMDLVSVGVGVAALQRF